MRTLFPYTTLFRSSRHLGLDTANAEQAIEAAADHVSQHLDLDALLAATATPPTPSVQAPAPTVTQGSHNVLIARDPAFHFLYPENIKALETWGRVEFFSPLETSNLPKDIDLLYLPGGYPELYLEQLAKNKSLMQDIRDHAIKGGKIIAECGGMLFLGRSITDQSDQPWPMVGLLDIATTMSPKKLTLGYRSYELGGLPLKGHEFHYSQYVGAPPAEPIFHTPNLLASYSHFYWGENPAALLHWLG